MATAAQLSENSHQGFDGIKAALCLGSMKAKSNTASEMPVCLWQNGIGSRSTGKERDAETGLDYFGARYYSGPQGRYTSPDPLMASANVADPQSWNRYTYVQNNPLKYIDPLGLYASPAFSCSEAQKNCLNETQRRILNNSSIEIDGKTYKGEALYGKMNEKQQNAFVNITDKLASIQLEGGGTALGQVNSITADPKTGLIADDRIYAKVDSGLAQSIPKYDFTSAPGHGAFDNSFKSMDGPFGNIQMSFMSGKNNTYADIDIDIGNITNGLLGGIVHAGEVIWNKATGTTTNQDTIRRILIANPKVAITPSTDPKFNRK